MFGLLMSLFPAKAELQQKVKTELQQDRADGTSLDAKINAYFRGIVKDLPKEPRKIPMHAQGILEQIDKDVPTDIEVILSLGTKTSRWYKVFGMNPMGHIAIRIDDKVHTINGLVVRGEDPKIIQDGSLFQYLYGLEAPTKNIFHGDAYGNSYIQGAISVRVSGVSRADKDKMLAYINQLNQRYSEGFLEFKLSDFNCSTYVFSALTRGGLLDVVPKELEEVKTQGTKMPLDIFVLALGTFRANPNYKTTLVYYPQITLPEQIVSGVKFPVSSYRKMELMKTWWTGTHELLGQADIRMAYDQKTNVLTRYDRRK